MLFGLIYEMNGHGVYSFSMAHGFIFPLALGLVLNIIIYITKIDDLPSEFSSYMYNAGVATISMGGYFRGVLEIFGTTRDFYVITFNIVGYLLLVTGILAFIIPSIQNYRRLKREAKENKHE